MISYLTIFSACAPVFIIIAAGYACRRLHLVNKESDKSLVKLTLNILFPAFIIDHILGNEKLSSVSEIGLASSTGFISLILGISLCYFISGILKTEGEQRRAFAVTTGLQNYGFIPIPIVLALYPDAYVIVGVLLMHSVGVELALWTAGVMILSGERTSIWRRLLNVPLITTVICLIINFLGLGIEVHAKVEGTCNMLGNCAVPISIILFGAKFHDFIHDSKEKIFNQQRSAEAILAVIMRMLFLPIVLLLYAKFAQISPELKKVLVIQAAMPAAVFPIILTKEYGGDTNTSVRIVIVTTLLSVITIPPAIVFGLWFVGISS
ncbi:MAG: AEC family transporter [Verrucomicrobiota bacterium]|nr:AEC family transporter [Verrucomicrobiota bacterium]